MLGSKVPSLPQYGVALTTPITGGFSTKIIVSMEVNKNEEEGQEGEVEKEEKEEDETPAYIDDDFDSDETPDFDEHRFF